MAMTRNDCAQMHDTKQLSRDVSKQTDRVAKNEWSYMLIESKPRVDEKELFTIITVSLRSLFGACQPHCVVEIIDTKGRLAVVKCASSSLASVRASLTMPTPPPFMQNTIYRFDVLRVQNSAIMIDIENS